MATPSDTQPQSTIDVASASTKVGRDRLVKLTALWLFKESDYWKALEKERLQAVIFDRTMRSAREPWGGASGELEVSFLDTDGVEVPAGERRYPEWADPDSPYGRRALAVDKAARIREKKRVPSALEAPSRTTGRSAASSAEGVGRRGR